MTTRTTFVKTIYRGRRFDDHSMPVDLLPDLAAYRDIVVEVARAIFMQRHPTRRRLPKNFAENFQLTVRVIAEGSAAPVLERPDADHQSRLPLTQDVFDHARDLVNECVAAVSRGQAVPQAFPRAALARFNTLGQNLRPDEWIELLTPRADSGPRFDREVRKRIVLSASTTYRQPVSVTGHLEELSKRNLTYDVALADGTRVTGRFGAERLPRVLEAFGMPNAEVQVRGTGEYDAWDRLRSIVETHDLVPVSSEVEPDVAARLSELRALSDGWFDGAGVALSAEGLDRLEVVLGRLSEEYDVRAPFLYPTPEGEIQAEWSFEQFEVSACFDFDAGRAWLHAAATRAELAQDLDVAMDDVAGIAAFVRQFTDRRGEVV